MVYRAIVFYNHSNAHRDEDLGSDGKTREVTNSNLQLFGLSCGGGSINLLRQDTHDEKGRPNSMLFDARNELG